MRSKWITHKGISIFYQDFSGHDLFESDVVKKELEEVQAVVVQQPINSLLVLSDFTNTQVGKDLMNLLTESSRVTKTYVKKTAVLGVTGTKYFMANMLMRLTGQPITLFTDEEEAKDWLIK